MGNIIWNYCQESEVYIMNYMMGVHYSEDAVQEKITSSIDTAIKNGYSIKFSTHLDQFMVIYNIIRVLRDEMGYRLAWFVSGGTSQLFQKYLFKEKTTCLEYGRRKVQLVIVIICAHH